MGDLTREDLKDLRDELRQGFAGVHARLDDLNHRTRTNESDIAVLQDRSTREWWERLLSGGIGASLVGLGAVLKNKIGL